MPQAGIICGISQPHSASWGWTIKCHMAKGNAAQAGHMYSNLVCTDPMCTALNSQTVYARIQCAEALRAQLYVQNLYVHRPSMH
eukprot:1157302-Pelagomonas_calceolata.AAC.24